MPSMGSHQSASMETDEWLTPPELIRALGSFDLDPCALQNAPWPTAETHYTVQDDGLAQPWHGRVWLNPPYSRQAVYWMRRMAKHGHGTALVFARTETAWFFETVWRNATAALFLEGRLYFYRGDGKKANFNAGAPSVLVAYGRQDAGRLKSSNILGQYVAW